MPLTATIRPHQPILALDTATESCSVAVLLPDGQCISRHTSTPRQHTQLLFSFIDEVLNEAGLSKHEIAAVACGQGPGAFTGVRIAIAATQGLGLALGCPLIPVNSLMAVAASGWQHWLQNNPHTPNKARLLAATDARMGEVYAQAFIVQGDSMLTALAEPGLLKPEQLRERMQQNRPDCLAGDGFRAYPNVLDETVVPAFPQAASHAAIIAKLACQVPVERWLHDPAMLLPRYVRNQVTHSA